jgi:methyl-accepting chemotaxis protein
MADGTENILNKTLNRPGWWVNTTLVEIRNLLADTKGLPRQAVERVNTAADQASGELTTRTRETSTLFKSLNKRYKESGYQFQHSVEQLAKGAWNSETSFRDMLAPLAIFGGAVGFAAGEVAQLAEHYQKAVAMGLTFNGSLFEMSQAAHEAGLTVAEMVGLMDQNQAVVSAYGAKQMAFMTGSARAAMRDAGMFGMTMQEANKHFTDYLDTQRILDSRERMSTEAMSASFANLVENSTALARITGKQRDEVLQNMMKTKKQGDVSLTASLIRDRRGEKAAKTFSDTLGTLNEIPGEIGGIFKNMAHQMGRGLSAITAEGATEITSILGDRPAQIMQQMLDGSLSQSEGAAQLQGLLQNLSHDQRQRLDLLGAFGDKFGSAVTDSLAAVRGLAGTKAEVDEIVKSIRGLKFITRNLLNFQDRLAQAANVTKSFGDSMLIVVEDTLNSTAEDAKEKLSRLFEGMNADEMLDGVTALLQKASEEYGPEIAKKFESMLPADALATMSDAASKAGSILGEVIGPDWMDKIAQMTGRQSRQDMEQALGAAGMATAALAAVGGAAGLKRMLKSDGTIDRATATRNNLLGGGDLGRLASLFGGGGGAAAGTAATPGTPALPGTGADPLAGTSLTEATRNLVQATENLSNSNSGLMTKLATLTVGAAAGAGLYALFQSQNNPVDGLTGAVSGLQASVQRLETASLTGDLSMSVGMLDQTMTRLTDQINGLATLSSAGSSLTRAADQLAATTTTLNQAMTRIAESTEKTATGIAETNTKLTEMNRTLDDVRRYTKTTAETP